MNYDTYLAVATQAAHLTGEYIAKMHGSARNIKYKGEIDLVTEVDLASEKMIVQIITKQCPDHSILAEESGLNAATSDFKWIIDPLDGTTNFAHGFPHYCVSIALEYKGELIVGVVNDPFKKELFYATKGGGAFLNNQPIHVSTTDCLDRGLLATGFPYDVRTGTDNNITHFHNFLLTSQAVRRPGSAALDLCYVACGRFDGF